MVKNPPAGDSGFNAGDLGSNSGLGRSPREGNSYPLQCSSLEKSMDRGVWEATVHGVAKSRTWLSDFHFFMFLILAASLSPYLTQDVKHEALDKMFSKQLLMFSFKKHPRITTNSFRSFYFLKTGTINAFHPPECLMSLTTPQRSWTVI